MKKIRKVLCQCTGVYDSAIPLEIVAKVPNDILSDCLVEQPGLLITERNSGMQVNAPGARNLLELSQNSLQKSGLARTNAGLGN
jgi:hypothetical protein